VATQSSMKGFGFEVSQAQRQKIRGRVCVVCWRAPCDPAHLIDRSIAADRKGDPLRVIPLCRQHHDAYDRGELDLLPELGDEYIDEIAHAVVIHPRGIIGALERMTNRKWAPTS
jgi:hypothetical protein